MNINGIREVVPTYRSLLVYFDPLVISRQTLAEKILQLLKENSATEVAANAGRVVEIPVCYGGDFGPDIEFVANHNGLAVKEVVEIHTATPYKIYMLGFIPGFPYLGGMSERLNTPRLETPRTVIPAGSVGIAGTQTGFYPLESPGGWRIIGRTPLKGFDSQSENPFLFRAGDYLSFRSVTPADYTAIKAAADAGNYKPRILSLGSEAGDCL
jgi:inhibitor of KinA